jgi:hypothetical protein
LGSPYVVCLNAPFGGAPFRKQALENPPRDPNHPSVLADLDPELYRLPLGSPAGVLGDDGWGNGCPFALSCSVCDRMKDPHLRRPKEMTGGKSAQLFADEGIG